MIIVTGIARCGTSTVARLLHEQTHICMGHQFPPKDQWNPLGYYECAGSYDIVANSWEIENDLALLHARHGCNKYNYGVKHPKICELDLKVVNPELIIVCIRDKESIIKSSMTFRAGIEPKPRAQCEQFYEWRKKHIDKILRSSLNVRTIDFTNRRTDEEIVGILDGWL